MDTFLHIPTLLFTVAAASLCICFNLILTWSSSRKETYILSWGMAFGLAILTMILVALRDRVPYLLSVTVADAILLASFGSLWFGYRQFTGCTGRFDRWFASAGAVIWLLLAVASSVFEDMNARSAILSGIELAYFVFIVIELVRHYRREPLPSVGLTAAVVGAHAMMQLYWVTSSITGPIEPTTIVLPNSLVMGLRFTESSIFVVFLGLLQLVMVGQRSERHYRIAAETDSLTGLVNRGHFFGFLGPSLIRSDRGGALILFDIDHFKSINDTHGHPTGDQALKAFAAILDLAATDEGIAARIGGEEFALFLPSAATGKAAEVADRVRQMTAELQIPAARGAVGFTVSCGVAGVCEIGSDFQTLHAAADAALYAAKGSGRNRVARHRSEEPCGHVRLGNTDMPAAPVL